MKKLLLILSAFLLCFVLGCGKTVVNDIDEDKSIIFVASSSVLEINEDSTLEDYIVALRDAGELTFNGDKGDYGLFITSMNGKANEIISSTPSSSEGYSWTLYIDFTSHGGVIYAGDSKCVTYNGTTLYQASYGVSSIPCLKNHTYAFVYEYYSFKW